MTYQLLSILNGLQVFLTIGGRIVLLKIRFDALVLLVKVGKIRHQVLDNVH